MNLLTFGSRQFESFTPGRYLPANTQIGDLPESIKFSPARKSKNGLSTIAASYAVQSLFRPANSLVDKTREMNISVVISASQGYTASEIAEAVTNLNFWLQTDSITRMIAGGVPSDK